MEQFQSPVIRKIFAAIHGLVSAIHALDIRRYK